MISNLFSANTLRLAKVTYVHPEGQKMEVMFLDNGDYGRDVQVMSPYAGTDFGFTGGIPSPEAEGLDANKTTDPDKRSIVAVIASLQGTHICLGFLFPQITHMAFTKKSDKNRMIERHTSDFYRTVDDGANMDMVHPGSVSIRMGVGETPTSLEGRDFDKRFKIKKNKGGAITLALVNRSGGNVTRVVLMPTGDIEITATKNILIQADVDVNVIAKNNVNVKADKNVAIEAKGSITAKAAKNIDLTAGTDINIAAGGKVKVTGTRIDLN